MSRSSFVLEHVHSIQEYGREKQIDGSKNGQARALTEMYWRRLNASPEAQSAEP